MRSFTESFDIAAKPGYLVFIDADLLSVRLPVIVRKHITIDMLKDEDIPGHFRFINNMNLNRIYYGFDFRQLYARNMGTSFLVKRYYLLASIDCTIPTSLTTLVGSPTSVLTIKL